MRNTSSWTNGPDGAGPSAAKSPADPTMSPAPTPLTAVVHHSTDGELSSDIEDKRMRRSITFQYLVRRYMSQILYGCHKRNCTTPMCKSAQIRVRDTPYKPPTVLTARMLAYYLAAQDDPGAGLCQHALHVSPFDIGCDASSWLSRHDTGSAQMHEPKGTPHKKSSTFWSKLDAQHAPQLDKLSLSQNLFDTVALIYFYFKRFPVVELSSHANPFVQQNCSQFIPVDNDETQSKLKLHKEEKDILEQRNIRVSDTDGALPAGQKGSLDDGLGCEQSTLRFKLPSELASTKVGINHGISEAGGASDNMKSSFSREFRDTPRKLPTPRRHGSEKFIPPRTLTCATMEKLKVLLSSSSRLDKALWRGYMTPYSQNYFKAPDPTIAAAEIFLRRSLSDIDRLLHSFADRGCPLIQSPLSHLNPTKLESAFRGWSRINGAFIFDCLWEALEPLFRPPPEIIVDGKEPRLRTPQTSVYGDRGKNHTARLDTKKSADGPRYIPDCEAAYVIIICIHALTSQVPRGSPSVWPLVRERSHGVHIPASATKSLPRPLVKSLIEIIDAMQYEPALRLAERLIRAISARRCFFEILNALEGTEGNNTAFDLMRMVLEYLQEAEKCRREIIDCQPDTPEEHDGPGWSVSAVWLEWLKTICVTHWDKEPLIKRWNVVGGAIDMMNEMAWYRPRMPDLTDEILYDKKPVDQFGLTAELFRIPYFYANLDKVKVPGHFARHIPTPNHRHVLNYPFLYSSKELLVLFRTFNYSRMFSTYETAERSRCLNQMLDVLARPNHSPWHSAFKDLLSRYLLLDVRRNHALEDSFNQLWHLSESQLLRPLKVRIGALEGEDGVDQGGVSLEFFHVALAEAFNPDNGIFTTDPHTRMTWFKPASPASLAHCELIGLLFSLAVYNGITLPVTFPIVFYYFLLDLSTTHSCLSLLQDGWPDLARSLHQLLTWEDGDVSEIYGGSHEFTFDAFGETITVNMLDPASSQTNPRTDRLQVLNKVYEGNDRTYVDPRSTDEAPLVTNDTRAQFVNDYIFWLVYQSVAPQLHAFRQGFLRCLDPTILSLFDPVGLRKVIEGYQYIDMNELKCVAKYEDGYAADHPTIAQFWNIVLEYDDVQKAKLLEFVTASDRVPVGGVGSMMFAIVRNGGDSEMLPTSSTCFGKLLLPEYAGQEKMRQKLELALSYSKGFGAL
ncbi:hypothetical protein EJ05DRAFT_536470 [Pseudovirgaria hyperparasitica]|uniref:HECT-type E3 ubiquitin transferase n=1 Tax=Pseudovirgaria hyperparasitica TaxID=470096 RepID=A0A6A6WED0_9PEZI|nr:uncharacterized protein EJ05DRAFT_536470 [Pseudovirgaria hyperparasitica]KAF2760350.1 hypothetical protein EJ05DRAFT_536470 [Pseudovirgaria hyperparasitica]